MADFLCVRIIGVLLSNTKHLLTSRRDRCRRLLRHCIDKTQRANMRLRIARAMNDLLHVHGDVLVGSVH